MFIDGIKIDVDPCDGVKWLESPLLKFKSIVDEQTGEVLSNSKYAYYKGLRFSITESSKYKDLFYYGLRGSLSKYRNNGIDNFIDFDFDTFLLTIKSLADTFHIDPNNAILRNIEFGVNVLTPIPSQKVINYLIASKSDTFTQLKLQKFPIGKTIAKQRYHLKIYDKGKQTKRKNRDVLRVEIAVKKMDYLKNLSIKTLSDLTEITNISPLIDLLLNEWKEIIYYDTGIKYRQMSEFEKKKFLFYLRPAAWSDFNRMQRMRAKKHFNKLLEKYGSSKTKSIIHNRILEKWQLLTANKCIRLNQDNRKSQPIDMYTFEQLEYTDQMYTSVLDHRSCLNCQKSIANKSKVAIYCSKKCNNRINGIRRTEKRRLRIENECIVLNELLSNISKSNLSITIYYIEDNAEFYDTLEQTEIHDSKIKITSIKVHSEHSEKTQILTTKRAKNLLKIISNINANNES